MNAPVDGSYRRDEKHMDSLKNFGLACVIAFSGLGPSFAQSTSPDKIWAQSPVIISHTHIDPANIKDSVQELIDAGVTTAFLNLTIDDGDWSSASPNNSLPPFFGGPSAECIPEGYQWYPQNNDSWGKRFDERLLALESLEQQGKIKIVKSISDIPDTPEKVMALRAANRLTVVVSSEGSNQIEGGHHLEVIEAAVKSIAAYRARGWVSTALVHQLGSCEIGHRLLWPEGLGLNPAGDFVASMLMHAGILVDMPHLTAPVRNEILAIAEMAGRPVMISHDNPARFLKGPDDQASLQKLVCNGQDGSEGTGVIGVHSYKAYIGSSSSSAPTLSDFADEIASSGDLIATLTCNGGRPTRDKHLALGLDWFFLDHAKNRAWKLDWAGRAAPDSCASSKNGCLKDLVGLLISRNYEESEIKNILGGNMIKLLRAAWAQR
jgi:microsomal dipeptidase-like Zn-dependent dipeptidase